MNLKWTEFESFLKNVPHRIRDLETRHRIIQKSWNAAVKRDQAEQRTIKALRNVNEQADEIRDRLRREELTPID